MVDTQQLMIALQSPVGLRFGSTTQVDSERVTFEIDLKIPKGTACRFRMELSGSDATVMGELSIERVLPKRANSPPRYQARIIDMPEMDRELFDGWRRDLATGGVSRQVERDLEKIRQRMAEEMGSGKEYGIPDREAVEARDEGRGQMRDNLRSSQAELSGLSSASGALGENVEMNASGFAAVDLEPEEDEVVEMEESVTPEPGGPPSPAPSWIRESAVRVPAQQEDEQPPPSLPIVVVNASVQPVELTVIYLSDAAFMADYERTLRTGAVTIDHSEITELYQPFNVKLQMANGEEMETIGHAIAQTPDGMAISLELDADQRARLRALASA